MRTVSMSAAALTGTAIDGRLPADDRLASKAR
jgi:hypothetical protein